MTKPFHDEAEIEATVHGFESCITAKDQFTHRSHLTVAVCFLRDSNTAAAIERMRNSLFRFLDYHHVSRGKYNETLTLFWMKMVERSIHEMDSNCSLLEITNSVLKKLGNSRLVFDYYSESLLFSDMARRTWVEPNLRAL
jgi:hypothetical protein